VGVEHNQLVTIKEGQGIFTSSLQGVKDQLTHVPQNTHK
jgi:hypothetical protein